MGKGLSVSLFVKSIDQKDDFNLDADKRQWFIDEFQKGNRIAVSDKVGCTVGFDLSEYRGYKIIKL